MKKIASLVGAGAMLLVMAVPAFAVTGFPWWPMPKPTEATVKNFADVDTDIFAKANTGFNSVFSGFTGGTIKTGEALASGNITSIVNTNTIGCDCYDDLFVKNFADVNTDIFAKANTGFNKITGGIFSGGSITSGAAAAGGIVSSVVNTNVVGD